MINDEAQNGKAPRQRRRWSVEEKQTLVERWKESGRSRAEFCRAEQLSYGYFLSWEKRLKQAANEPSFVEVVAESDDGFGKEWGIEVVAPNGWRIRMAKLEASNEAIAGLKELFNAVGQC